MADLSFSVNGTIRSEMLAPELAQEWDKSNQSAISRLNANGYSMLYLSDVIMSGGRILHIGTPTFEWASGGRENANSTASSPFLENTGYGLFIVSYLMPMAPSSIQSGITSHQTHAFPPLLPGSNTLTPIESPVVLPMSPLELPLSKYSISVPIRKQKKPRGPRKPTKHGDLDLHQFYLKALQYDVHSTGFDLKEMWKEEFLRCFPVPTWPEITAIVKRVNKHASLQQTDLRFDLCRIGPKGYYCHATLEKVL